MEQFSFDCLDNTLSVSKVSLLLDTSCVCVGNQDDSFLYECFDVHLPENWNKWSKRFEQFRVASGLSGAISTYLTNVRKGVLKDQTAKITKV